MKINRKQLVKQIKDEKRAEKSRRVSLYIHGKTVDAFMAACKRDGLSASNVVEKMMRQYVESEN